MPWPDKQRRAIAARMVREGKSPEEISRFFREHGYGAKDDDAKNKPKSKRKTR